MGIDSLLIFNEETDHEQQQQDAAKACSIRIRGPTEPPHPVQGGRRGGCRGSVSFMRAEYPNRRLGCFGWKDCCPYVELVHPTAGSVPEGHQGIRRCLSSNALMTFGN